MYWFLTYEVAGAILLTVFGAASVGFALLLALWFVAALATRPAIRRRHRPGVEGSFGSAPGEFPAQPRAT